MDYTFIPGKPSIEIDRGFKRWLLKCCQVYKYNKNFALNNAKMMQKIRQSASNSSKEIVKRQIDTVYKKLLSGLTKQHTHNIYMRQLKKMFKLLNKPFNENEFKNLPVNKLYEINAKLFNAMDNEQQRRFYTSFMVKPIFKILRIKNSKKNNNRINNKIKNYLKEHYHLPEDVFFFAKDSLKLPKKIKPIKKDDINDNIKDIINMAYLDINLDDIEDYDLKKQDYQQFYELSRKIINLFNQFSTSNNKQAVLAELNDLAFIIKPIYNRIVNNIKLDKKNDVFTKQQNNSNQLLEQYFNIPETNNNNLFFNRLPIQIKTIKAEIPQSNEIFKPNVINPNYVVKNNDVMNNNNDIQPQVDINIQKVNENQNQLPNNNDLPKNDDFNNNLPKNDDNDDSDDDDDNNDDGISKGLRLLNQINNPNKVFETENDLNLKRLQNLIDNEKELRLALEMQYKNLLENKENQLNAEKTNNELKQQELTNKINLLTAQNQQYNDRIKANEEQFKNFKIQISNLNNNIQNLKQEKENLSNSNFENQNAIKEKEEQIRKLENEKNDLLLQSQQIKQQLENTNTLYEQTKSSLESDVSNKNSQINQLENQDLNSKKTIEDLKNEIDRLKFMLQESERVKINLENDIQNNSLASKTEIESEKARTNAIINNLKNQIEQYENQIKEINNGNAKTKEIYEQLIKTKDNSINDYKNQINSLNEQIKKENQRYNDELKQYYDKYTKEIEDLKNIYNTNDAEYKKQVEILKNEYENRVKKLEDDNNNKIKSLTNEKDTLIEQNKSLLDELNRRITPEQTNQMLENQKNQLDRVNEEKLKYQANQIVNAIINAYNRMKYGYSNEPEDTSNLQITNEDSIKLNELIKDALKTNPFNNLYKFSNKRYRIENDTPDNEKHTHIEKDTSITEKDVKMTDNSLVIENDELKNKLAIALKTIQELQNKINQPVKDDFKMEIEVKDEKPKKEFIKKDNPARITETNSNVPFNQRILETRTNVPEIPIQGTKDNPIDVNKPLDVEIETIKVEPSNSSKQTSGLSPANPTNSNISEVSQDTFNRFIENANRFYKTNPELFTQKGTIKYKEFNKFKQLLGDEFKDITWKQYRDNYGTLITHKSKKSPNKSDVSTSNIIPGTENKKTTRSGKGYNVEKLHNKYASKIKPKEFDALLYTKLKKHNNDLPKEKLDEVFIEELKDYDKKYRPNKYNKRIEKKKYDNYTGSGIFTTLLTVIPSVISGVKKLFGKNKECLNPVSTQTEEKNMYEGSKKDKLKKKKKDYKGCAVMSLSELDSLKNSIH